VFCWEFLQNLPLIAGLLSGLSLWQDGRLVLAIACMFGGSAVGSLAIWATEARIMKGHREPPRVVFTNWLVFGGLMIGLAAYVSAPWSRWWLDLVLGAAAALALGAAQDWAAGSPLDVGHCAAMAAAFGLAVMGLRMLVASLPVLVNVLVITSAVTVVIVLVDYGPFSLKRLGSTGR
jgi:hypothetical protein